MNLDVFLIFVGMGLVTYIPRYLPLALFTRIQVPEIVNRWLSYVPVAILAALLAPGVLMDGPNLFVSYNNPFFVAAIPTFLVAVLTKSMGITVLAGMILVIGLRSLL